MQEQEEAPVYLIKVVIIGDSGVGKSNVMSRFTNDTFSADSKTTIGVAFATKSIVIDTATNEDGQSQNGKKTVKLQVWDTAGQERYRALSSAYYRGALGALVVYDITNRQSLESISKWLEEIDRYCTQEIVVILVGNKLDLNEQRCVTVEEGKALAAKENMFFIETSAKDAINIEKAFVLLSKEIIQASPTVDGTKKPDVKDGVILNPGTGNTDDTPPAPTPSGCSC